MPKSEMTETMKPRSLRVRIHMDPQDASRQGDRFILESSNGSYSQVKSVKDDMVAGDQFVDLEYTDLISGTSYTLEVAYERDGKTECLFEGVPISGLCRT